MTAIRGAHPAQPMGLGEPLMRPGPGGGEDQASRLRALVEGPRVAGAGNAQRRVEGAVTAGAAQRAAPPRARAKIIAVASGKGGVGKTNVAVNLAVAMTAQGCRVTLLDADLGTANADVLCGLMPGVRLDEVVRSGVGDAGRRLREIAVEAPGGFRLVPGSAGIARMADLPPTQRLKLIQALGELEADADVLLIDTAAGVGAGVTSFLRVADLGVVVTTPEPPAVADAYALIKCLAAANGGALGGLDAGETLPLALLVNQVSGPAEAAAVHGRIAAVCRRFLGLNLPYAGCIAHDARVVTAVRSRRPFTLMSPRCQASRDLQGLASSLMARVDARRGLWEKAGRNPSRIGGLFARLFGGGGAVENQGSPEFLKT